jgi:hypothetical protein
MRGPKARISALMIFFVLGAGQLLGSNVGATPGSLWGSDVWTVTADGAVYGPTYHGPIPNLDKPIVGMASTPSGNGYWLVAADGGVFSYGGAAFYGSAANLRLTKPIVGMASTPSGNGYWLVAADGGVFSYGGAAFYGSAANLRLTKPIVGMASTPSGNGYWLVAADGGVFSYGGAAFHGSLAGSPLDAPVVGITATANGAGYWIDGSDGGIFTFGNAGFFGAIPVRPGSIVGPVMPTPDDQGYWLAFSDAVGCQSFGDAECIPSAGSNFAYPAMVGAAVDPGSQAIR